MEAEPMTQPGSPEKLPPPCKEENSADTSSPEKSSKLVVKYRRYALLPLSILFLGLVAGITFDTFVASNQTALKFFGAIFLSAVGACFGYLISAYKYDSLRAEVSTLLAFLSSKLLLDNPDEPVENIVQRMNDVIAELLRERDTIMAQHSLVTTHIAASVIIRDIDGRILFCSPYTQVLTGYSVDELMGRNDDLFASIVVEEDRDRYHRAQMVSTLAEDISVKFRILHKSGLRLWLEMRLVPVCDENGELISVMSVAIDVTDSLSYQQQIEEQNRDLSDFAYMVSHDLKAPIFTIKGMASALSEDYREQLGNDGGQLLQYIIDATQRLEQLVASVLEFSAVATKDMQRETVRLSEVLTSVCSDLTELTRQKDAEIIIEGTLPTVRANSIRLYQVFSNLLGNALKYSSPDRKPRIMVRHRRGLNGMYCIDIVDNGLGIPSSKLEDIFRPYFRAHGKEIEGNGIGLACVKKIVDRLGGTVTATSEEGVGSTFTVSFPAPPPEAREIPEDLARCFEQ